MVACLAAASSMMVFAAECPVAFYGQQPTDVADGMYLAIIVGDTELQESDVRLSPGARFSWPYVGQPWGVTTCCIL